VKKFENRSTFGEVMDNNVVPCFFDSQCIVGAMLYITDLNISSDVFLTGSRTRKPEVIRIQETACNTTKCAKIGNWVQKVKIEDQVLKSK